MKWLYFAVLYIGVILPLHALELVYEAASDTGYDHPHDVLISADGQLLYVADNGNDRIAVLDAHSLELLGSFGESELSEPHDVAFDQTGHLLVADTGGSRIAIYEVDGIQGKLVGELKEKISRPEGVAVHPDGRVYATGAASGNLVVYEQGKVVGEVQGFASPHDVVIAPDRTLWIADAANDRIVNVSEELQIINTLAGAPYDFHGPRYFDFDERGRLYVADKYSHQIKVLAPDLSLALVMGGKHSTFGPGYFNHPEGISIYRNQVWFADTYNDRIVRYRISDM
jgi:DNA-binding beta-propeller fold protein YncE